MSTVVVGLDVQHLDERQADHDLRGLVRVLPEGTVTVAATHRAVADDLPHVALSVEVLAAAAPAVVTSLTRRLGDLAPRWSLVLGGEAHGDAGLQTGAEAARQAHLGRRSGRLVRFPGVEVLVGTMTVRELLERSAVERVRVLTAGGAPADARVVTRDHVRPVWAGGELVLLTQPAVGGTLVPFESPTPTPCCADH